MTNAVRSDRNLLARELLEGFDWTPHWMRWALGTATDLTRGGTGSGLQVLVLLPAAPVAAAHEDQG